MRPRITFLVNGLGLGNSTRCHAIIEQLHERGCEVDVLTSGNGLWYFRQCAEVSVIGELGSFSYGRADDRLSVAKTLRKTRALMRVHVDNHATVSRFFAERPPDVVVLDSMYNVRAARRLGVPVVAVNNSDVTVMSYASTRRKPASIALHFALLEVPDLLFHGLIPDLVISPTIDPAIGEIGRRVRRVHPIVRRAFDQPARVGPPSRAVVMVSGSQFGMDVRPRREHFPVKIDVLGREAPADFAPRDDFAFHGKCIDPLPMLRQADLAVVNGGFSTVSEMVCLRIPMIVVPVVGHAEQWLNAKTVETLGLGRIACERTWETVMIEMLGDLNRYRAAANRSFRERPGAVQAAEAIVELARKPSLDRAPFAVTEAGVLHSRRRDDGPVSRMSARSTVRGTA